MNSHSCASAKVQYRLSLLTLAVFAACGFDGSGTGSALNSNGTASEGGSAQAGAVSNGGDPNAQGGSSEGGSPNVGSAAGNPFTNGGTGITAIENGGAIGALGGDTSIAIGGLTGVGGTSSVGSATQGGENSSGGAVPSGGAGVSSGGSAIQVGGSHASIGGDEGQGGVDTAKGGSNSALGGGTSTPSGGATTGGTTANPGGSSGAGGATIPTTQCAYGTNTGNACHYGQDTTCARLNSTSGNPRICECLVGNVWLCTPVILPGMGGFGG